MAKIKPFKGVLYDPAVVGDMSKVVAPPYDVISDSMQNEYYGLHPNNVIRLILGKINKEDTGSDNRYTRAKRYFEEWLDSGVLAPDDKPSIYIYEQKYFFKDELKTRLGFISLLKIEDPRESMVLPHEYTLAKPKQDRLDLMKSAKANLSPIFSLFKDDGSSVKDILKKHIHGNPIIDIEGEGVSHKLWRLSDPEDITKISDLMKDKQVLIADGHHRYEVALNFRDWARGQAKDPGPEMPYENVMVFFSSLSPEALTVLSTHRVIKGVEGFEFGKTLVLLKEYFNIEKVTDRETLLSAIENEADNNYVFGMYCKNEGFFSLSLKDKEMLEGVVSQEKEYEWKCLDVTVLHQLIFDRILKIKEKVADTNNILYTRDIDYAMELVDTEEYQMTFFLNPPKIEQIKDVAHSRERMPRKTTYFYPKLLSGLVFYKHED